MLMINIWSLTRLRKIQECGCGTCGGWPLVYKLDVKKKTKRLEILPVLIVDQLQQWPALELNVL